MRIEALKDDFRGAPLDFNLRQTIIVPDIAKEPSRLARVVQLGANSYKYSVKRGDVVLCNRYPASFQGFDWFDGDDWQRVALMKEEEILCRVT